MQPLLRGLLAGMLLASGASLLVSTVTSRFDSPIASEIVRHRRPGCAAIAAQAESQALQAVSTEPAPGSDRWSAEPETQTRPEEPTPAARAVRGSAEALLYAQRDRVDQALASIVPGTPGKIDAFLLAFASDANEDVFRNEALYAQRLFAERFGMRSRTLVLLNHPDSSEHYPLATLSNLRRALAGIGDRMQRDEDLLLLFATTHGAEDHWLYVDFEPLPLDQIDPESLRDALDGAAIDWRVLVLSACYSGGFIDALRSPQTLVITSARADRSSFGCGSQAELTYFGRAFLVDALNRTQSLTRAFELARRRVARMEKAEDFDASDPQMVIGSSFRAHLARWESTLTPAPKVTFEPPSVSAPGCGQRDCGIPSAASPVRGCRDSRPTQAPTLTATGVRARRCAIASGARGATQPVVARCRC